MTKFIPLLKPNTEGVMMLGGDLKPEESIDPALLDLVKLHIAQIRQSPVEMEKHRMALKIRGETENRFAQLKIWREAPCFSDKEKSALMLGEALSLGSTGPTLNQFLEEARHHFKKEEIIALLLAIMAATDWSSARFKILRHVQLM